MFTNEEKTILINLVNDKIDICERHIKKFEKDYKYYTEDRARWVPDATLGSKDTPYAKEIMRQIDLEKDKIDKYNNLVNKIKEA